MTQTFPKTAHLTQAEDFTRVMQSGQRHKSAHCQIYTFPGTSPCSRLGLVVSRACGHAPARNRCKRLWREAFRLEQAAFARPSDIVIRVLPHSTLPPLESLRQHLRSIGQRP